MAEKAILAASDGGQDFLRSSHLQKFNVSSWRDLISDFGDGASAGLHPISETR